MPAAWPARRSEILEIDAIADDSHRHAGDQPFEITFLHFGMNQRARENLRNVPLIAEKPLRFDRVDPLQWRSRSFRVLLPFERVQITKMHDPRHTREMLRKLRHVAAVDDDKVGTQLSEILLDCAM
jgi:hypothetical protein